MDKAPEWAQDEGWKGWSVTSDEEATWMSTSVLSTDFEQIVLRVYHRGLLRIVVDDRVRLELNLKHPEQARNLANVIVEALTPTPS
jgi:hypothetical protein